MSQKRFFFIHHTMDVQHYWGGDRRNIDSLCQGLNELGHQAIISNHVEEALSADYVFLINAGNEITSSYFYLKLMNKPFGLIGFYEDAIHCYPPAWGLLNYVRGIIEEKLDHGYAYELDRLIENPKLIYYYSDPPKKSFLRSYDLVKDARLYIAQCKTEAGYVKRDCPPANVHCLFPDRKVPEAFAIKPNQEFCSFAGVEPHQYILQVGRFEVRKNQLASVLACKDLDIPLVFIATGRGDKRKPDAADMYPPTVFSAITKWRKAPTIVISQHMEPYENGSLKVIQMPDKKILSDQLLASAFANAGLYLHPAFNELPGLVYIEAMMYGVPVIASEWTALKEYFTDNSGIYHLDDRVEYCVPYDIAQITKLVEKKWGQRYGSYRDHPMLTRSKIDIAKDFVQIVENHFVSNR